MNVHNPLEYLLLRHRFRETMKLLFPRAGAAAIAAVTHFDWAKDDQCAATCAQTN